MEQRIGPTVPPTNAAGVDPAYVPGLLPPRAPAADEKLAGKPDAASGRNAASGKDGDAPEDAGREAAPATQEAEDAGAAADAEETADAASTAEADGGADTSDDEADGESGDGSDDEAAGDDGSPAFEVSDRRGSIRVDRTGVTFRLDSEVAEFGWDEVQAVEIDTPRFGKRFSVTVYTSTRRWFQSDVEAPNRAALKTWAAELDEVLDVHFDDGSEAESEVETDADADADAEAKTGTEPEAKSASEAKPASETKTEAAAEKAEEKASEDAETSA